MSVTGVKRKHTCTTLLTESKKLTWEVENFREMIAAATNADLQKNSYVFEAGDTIGLPSRWQLRLTKNGNNTLGILMRLLIAPKNVSKIKATWGFKTLKHEGRTSSFRRRIHQNSESLFVETFTDESSIEVAKSSFRYIPSFMLDDFPEDNLENGSLMIQIEFAIYKEVIIDGEYKRAKFEDKSRDAASDTFQRVLDSEVDADVTFVMADGRTLKAHGAILKARSRVFSAMLETDMQEAASGVIRIEDVSYEGMKAILKFIYTGKLDENWEELVDELVYASNKYELLLLLKFCDENLAAFCNPDNAWILMDFSKLYGLKTAEVEIAEYFSVHVDEILKAKIASDV